MHDSTSFCAAFPCSWKEVQYGGPLDAALKKSHSGPLRHVVETEPKHAYVLFNGTLNEGALFLFRFVLSP